MQGRARQGTFLCAADDPERVEPQFAFELALSVAALAATGAWAEMETAGGYTWTYRINGDRAEI